MSRPKSIRLSVLLCRAKTDFTAQINSFYLKMKVKVKLEFRNSIHNLFKYSSKATVEFLELGRIFVSSKHFPTHIGH